MIAFFRFASSEEMQKIDDDAVHICGFLGLNKLRSGRGCGTEDSSTYAFGSSACVVKHHLLRSVVLHFSNKSFIHTRSRSLNLLQSTCVRQTRQRLHLEYRSELGLISPLKEHVFKPKRILQIFLTKLQV